MHSQYLRHRDNSDSIVLDDDAVQIEASTSTKRSIRHPRFFMSDQKVTLRVINITTNKDYVFQVHRYFLERDSEFFRDMFTCPPTSGLADGQDEDSAILLPDVTVHELECLITFLYEGVYGLAFTLQDWTALLSISSRFLFDKVRDRAVREIAEHDPPLGPVERLVLAIKHDIPQWVQPAYTDICVREEPLTEEEADKLGMSMVVRLARMREELLRERSQTAPSVPNRPRFARNTTTDCGCRSCRQERLASDEADEDTKRVTKIVEEVMAMQ